MRIAFKAKPGERIDETEIAKCHEYAACQAELG